MTKLWIAALALAASGAARAATCVTVDPSRDNLAPDELRVAAGLVEQALRERGHAIAAEGEPCAETFAVTHARLGRSITVVLVGPGGSAQMTAATIEELPRLYPRLIEALAKGVPTETTATRHTVTADEEAPKRVAADGVGYAQIGYGATFGIGVGAGMGAGPALGAGYRHELDRAAVDVGILGTVPTDDRYSSVGFTVVRGLGLWFADPVASQTVYLGGGVGAGFVFDEGQAFGVQGEACAGYEILRASRIRLFWQVDSSLPFFDSAGGSWNPSLRFTMGFGWPPKVGSWL